MRRLTGTVLIAVLALITVGCTGILMPRGTGTIRGVVRVDGQPPVADHVEIQAVGTRFAAVVDQETGAYELKLPAPARYTLRTVGEGISSVTAPVAPRRDQVVTGIDFDVTYLPSLPIFLSFEDPNHQRLLQIPFENWRFEVKEDPFGDPALYYPPGGEDQRPPNTYDGMRFALLKYPDVDDFELQWETLGDPNSNHGNRSQAIIFGYQDMRNWWLIYLVNTATTRIAQIKDGRQTYVCHPNEPDHWWDDKSEYQHVRVTVTTEGDKKVVRTYVNETEIDSLRCNIPLSDYTPGQVGIGSMGTSGNQAMYVRNIQLDVW